MVKFKYVAFMALFVFTSVLFSASNAHAQTAGTILYNQDSSLVTSSSPSAGYYYTQPGGQSQNQVYYFGNGTYYNPSTGQYGTTSSYSYPVQSSGVGLYRQDGSQINNSAPIPAGYYYTTSGGQPANQVYYFGNGTYYNPTTGQYGTVSNVGVNTTVTTVSFPNTGAGGEAIATWMTLILSGLATIAGGVFITRRLAIR